MATNHVHSGTVLGSPVDATIIVEIVKVGRNWVGRRPEDRWNLETLGRKSWSDDQVKSREIGRSLAKDGINLIQVKGKIEAGAVNFEEIDPRPTIELQTPYSPLPARSFPLNGKWVTEAEFIESWEKESAPIDPIRQAIEEAMASLDWEAACGACEAATARMSRALSDDFCLKCGANTRPGSDLCDYCEHEVDTYPINDMLEFAFMDGIANVGASA